MYIIWAIAGIVFILSDLHKRKTIKLTLAGASLFCATICYKFPDNLLYQIAGFIVFFGVCHILITKILKKENENIEKLKKLNNAEGQLALVKKDIGKTFSIDGTGIISYNNELYQAKSVDDKEIKAGKTVEIVSRENLILNVKAVK